MERKSSKVMVKNPYSKNSKIQTVNSPTKKKSYAYSPPYISATLKNRIQYQKFKPIAPNPNSESQSGVKIVKGKELIQHDYYYT